MKRHFFFLIGFSLSTAAFAANIWPFPPPSPIFSTKAEDYSVVLVNDVPTLKVTSPTPPSQTKYSIVRKEECFSGTLSEGRECIASIGCSVIDGKQLQCPFEMIEEGKKKILVEDRHALFFLQAVKVPTGTAAAVAHLPSSVPDTSAAMRLSELNGGDLVKFEVVTEAAPLVDPNAIPPGDISGGTVEPQGASQNQVANVKDPNAEKLTPQASPDNSEGGSKGMFCSLNRRENDSSLAALGLLFVLLLILRFRNKTA